MTCLLSIYPDLFAERLDDTVLSYPTVLLSHNFQCIFPSFFLPGSAHFLLQGPSILPVLKQKEGLRLTVFVPLVSGVNNFIGEILGLFVQFPENVAEQSAIVFFNAFMQTEYRVYSDLSSSCICQELMFVFPINYNILRNTRMNKTTRMSQALFMFLIV